MVFGRITAAVVCIAAAITSHAATLRQPAALGKNANENNCTVQPRADTFAATDAEVFVAFQADRVAAGETLRIDWVAPSGEVASSIPYDGLPKAASLCFVSHLPVAGFSPGSMPGLWQVRVFLNNQLAAMQAFTIKPDANAGAARIETVTRTSALIGTEAEFTLDGRDFSAGSVVHVAQLANGAWRYIHMALPIEATASRIKIRIAPLPVGEYLAVIRDERYRVSNAARFVIASRESYKLPMPAGEPWQITQGPYGGFSHYGQALHAFDIAPVRARCLVAMRGGVVHAFDRGFGQSHASRTFGNYITIDHGDGEYSHYAHLASHTFIVKTGQRVEQGQALAVAGNSGYTFPMGGGHHVHVHVTRSFAISSQSIPFEFDDLKNGSRYRGTVISANRSSYCDCAKPGPNVPAPAGLALSAAPARPGTKIENGEVGVDNWWNHFVTVSPGAKVVDVNLTWDAADADLDLHLVSPSGKHYGWYGSTEGYSGQDGQPERFEIPNPEPGQWRVSVQGKRSAGGQVPFRVETYTPSVLASRSRK